MNSLAPEKVTEKSLSAESAVDAELRDVVTPRISAPRSHIYEWCIGRYSCPKCGELLSAPAYSEFLKRNNLRHTWMCDKCDYEFETVTWLNIPPGVTL